MSVLGESMCVCATKQDKTEPDPEKQIFKRTGQVILPNCLYPVLNIPQKNTHDRLYSKLSRSLSTKDMCNYPKDMCNYPPCIVSM